MPSLLGEARASFSSDSIQQALPDLPPDLLKQLR